MGGGGLPEPDDELGISNGFGAAFWIVVPRLSKATSRIVIPAISCDFCITAKGRLSVRHGDRERGRVLCILLTVAA